MVESIELQIRKLLLVGIIICMALTALGCIILLAKHGSEMIPNFVYHPPAAEESQIPAILQSVLTLSGSGVIQLGLLILVLMQVVRVALTGWSFMRARDTAFVAISVFILAVLSYSTLWRLF